MWESYYLKRDIWKDTLKPQLNYKKLITYPCDQCEKVITWKRIFEKTYENLN